MKKRIAVVDGKGGGLGRTICETLSKSDAYEIIALGTNAAATANMLKGGAHDGATGENAISVMVKTVDFIIGPISILAKDSMMGEVSATISSAISGSRAEKILLPLQRCSLNVVGVENMTIKDMLSRLDAMIAALS